MSNIIKTLLALVALLSAAHCEGQALGTDAPMPQRKLTNSTIEILALAQNMNYVVLGASGGHKLLSNVRTGESASYSESSYVMDVSNSGQILQRVDAEEEGVASGRVEVFNPVTGTRSAISKVGARDGFWTAKFSPDERHIVTCENMSDRRSIALYSRNESTSNYRETHKFTINGRYHGTCSELHRSTRSEALARTPFSANSKFLTFIAGDHKVLKLAIDGASLVESYVDIPNQATSILKTAAVTGRITVLEGHVAASNGQVFVLFSVRESDRPTEVPRQKFFVAASTANGVVGEPLLVGWSKNGLSTFRFLMQEDRLDSEYLTVAVLNASTAMIVPRTLDATKLRYVQQGKNGYWPGVADIYGRSFPPIWRGFRFDGPTHLLIMGQLNTRTLTSPLFSQRLQVDAFNLPTINDYLKEYFE